MQDPQVTFTAPVRFTVERLARVLDRLAETSPSWWDDEDCTLADMDVVGEDGKRIRSVFYYDGEIILSTKPDTAPQHTISFTTEGS